MGYLLAAGTGRRSRKERISTTRKRDIILLCTLPVLLLVFARPISNWLSSPPRAAVSSEKGEDFKCVNFTDPLTNKHDSLGLLPKGEKYMWYFPDAGFSNQARALKNALKIAMLLNRTLILPPVTDHGEVKNGKCLRPRYTTSRRFKEKSWTAVRDHILNSRYLSIADVVDLKPLSPKIVRTIDLRVFLALWCGLDVAGVCSGPKCRNFASVCSPHWGTIDICAQRFLPIPSSKGENSSCLVYEVKDDCSTTVWSSGENAVTRAYREHQLLQKLAQDPEITASSGSGTIIKRKDVVRTLALGSEAADFFLLSFGSLFSTVYKHIELHVDIRAAVGDLETAKKLEGIQNQHAFTKEIMGGAKSLVEKISPSRQFFCAHVRLGDGVFARNWNKTLDPLRKKLEELSKRFQRSQKLKVFLMTDINKERWNGTILAEIDRNDRFQVQTLDGHGDFIAHVAEQMMAAEHGFRLGFIPRISNAVKPLNSTTNNFVPDARLYLEEVICACARLGFLGTLKSTISRNIEDLRSASLCPARN
ncbi:hypothetical protein R1flu_004743 [Riccia fluitans]|uniref:O-fucosyltransferase family protein n=1 Tax=Riccia fluitans TaxID=41844 RepID=A0ABD1YU19_9MARC